FEGDRVGLIGPNGSGKTTLLRILAGIEEPDRGTRSVRRLLRIGYVAQDPVFAAEHTVLEVLRQALEASGGEEGEAASRLGSALARAGFTQPEQRVGTLSGGWRKRLAIARELIRAPDVLLLDEPTNHLDLEGILWLEGLLGSEPLAYLVVSHDRSFLENVAGRMLELNRVYARGLLAAEGRYSDFLLQRDELLRNQAEYQATLANKVRREVAWLQRGAKARSTKAKARKNEAGRLIEELDEWRGRAAQGPAGIDFTASGRRTRRLLAARGLVKDLGGRRVLDGIDLQLTAGVRLGLLGPNGSGKTTLLSLLAGTLEPDAGEIERALHLKIVLFDQNRESLDPGLPLRRALAPEGDSVVYRDRSLHVAAWAKRFLFRGEQLDTPVGRLSGGERARILIARLMLQPADLLILDEPTNDLDIPTLEVLEESLTEFPGALILVTHDRLLLNEVATEILALDGAGRGVSFADYAQWEAAHRSAPAPRRAAGPDKAPPGRPAPARRLSYRDQREWEQMEAKILEAEAAAAACEQAVGDPAVAVDPAALSDRCLALDLARAEVERLYARWAELEAKRR
ncbi:MAG: ABC-F family ATP-binding cassette domain-containing protein, partial [Acidobacteriota bacterium]|nr:ABC-F family ATP-binding cassette domain-containing protein [Acidobacteriota bacterium]